MLRLSLLMAFLLPGLVGQAGDWSQWRCDDGSGAIDGVRLPESWPKTLAQVWQVDVGAGLATPVIRDGKIWLFTRDGDEEVVRCLTADTGKQLWDGRYRDVFFANSQATNPRLFPSSRGRGTFATPALWQDSLFTLGVGKTLSCWKADSGQLLWRKAFFQQKLPEKLTYVCPPCNRACCEKTFDAGGACPDCGMMLNVPGLETSATTVGNYYGSAASPLLREKLGLVHVRKQDRGLVIAFDPANGEEHWTWEGALPASSSPVIARIAGIDQVVVLTRESLVGLHLERGDLLWRVPITSNAQIVTPIVHGDLVIFAQYRLPIQAVRVSRDGDSWKAEAAWENTEHPVIISTPVLHGDELFGFSSMKRGRFFSVNAADGSTRWLDEGNRGRSASLVNLGKTMAGLTNDGALLFWQKSGEGWQEAASYQVSDSQVWAHPVFFGHQVLIKDASHLTLYQF